MILVGRFGRDGILRLRRPLSPACVYSVSEEKGFALCHVRKGDGEYLATLERDRRIRESLVFNAYKGAVRTGTLAAAPRFRKAVLPVVSFSWGKREFDGAFLTAPLWESDGGRRHTLAVLRRGPGGWRIRMTSGASPGDECDAVLALAAAEVWIRMKQKQGGGLP